MPAKRRRAQVGIMRVDSNFYGSVPMADPGNAGTPPVERRASNDDVVACYENLAHWASTMDRLGYDTMWLTEHHFQYEGYEVVPNLILFGLHLVHVTERLRLGQMFNVVPQWHPLRLAEDFALADICSGGRMQFGVGRGTVPREAETLGAVVASGDNALSREADRVNREMFEEAMTVIRAAWAGERFSFSGKHYTFPPPGIPDRGSTVQSLTLVPRPLRPVEVYQAVSSPATLDYVAAQGFHGVFANQHPTKLKPRWEEFAEKAAAAGHDWGRGGGRVLVVNVHIGPTREEAFRTGRDPHDEFCRFLAPYGRFAGYLGKEYKTALGYQPTLEESTEQQIMAIGSVDDVVDTLGMWRELLGLEHLCCFFDMPGLSREQLDEQLHLFAGEVAPRLGITLDGPAGP
jgi:alkanesulfonate monooxygenase SsuD/methylene tetrahydromethanopterin reductase-like flavin-dependent oxidoreductase (luciferase family)